MVTLTLTNTQIAAIKDSLLVAIDNGTYVTARLLLEVLAGQAGEAEPTGTEDAKPLRKATPTRTTRARTPEPTADNSDDTSASASDDTDEGESKRKRIKHYDLILSERIFRLLKENPDGAALSEIQTTLGLAKRPEAEIKALIHDNRVYTTGAKRGTKYHAVPATE